jgi:transposase
VRGVPDELRSAAGRAFLDRLELPAADRERIEVALALVDALDRQLAPIEGELRRLARRQPGCRALMGHLGIGELSAPMILCELRRRRPPVRRAQGGPLRRARHRRPPIRPPLQGWQADQAGLATACSSPGSPAHPPRDAGG